MTSSVGSTNDLKPESLSRVNLMCPYQQPDGNAPRSSEERVDDLLEVLDGGLAFEKLRVDEECRNAGDAEFGLRLVADPDDAIRHRLILEAGIERLLGEAGKLGDLEQPVERRLEPGLLRLEEGVDERK